MFARKNENNGVTERKRERERERRVIELVDAASEPSSPELAHRCFAQLLLPMAYIPPHKRKEKEREKELLSDPLSPKFDKQLMLGPRHCGSKSYPTKTLPYTVQFAENSICRCYPVGSGENGELPDSVRLEPYLLPADSEGYFPRPDRKYFVLCNEDESKDSETSTRCVNKEDWLYISEKIQSDVLAAFRNVRSLIQDDEHAKLKPSFVARVGKILFHSRQSISLEKIKKKGFLTEFNPKSEVHRIFITDVTDAYMSFIENKMVEDIGFEVMEQKDQYLLKIQDKQRYDCVLTCKCIINADGKLELRKIKASPIRHLMIDLPCLSEDLDLRLMLLTKQIMESFTVGEECNMKEIIESAVIDPNMNGGLRWSLGKDSAGERFCVQETLHIVSKYFAGQTVTLKLRHVDRFNLISSRGKISKQASMKLLGVSKHLKEAGGGDEDVKEILQETLKLIWDNFIDCKI